MILPRKLQYGKVPLEFNKSIDLHEVYGQDFVEKTKKFDASTAEKMCLDMFEYLYKTTNPNTNMGDFVCNGKYYDQKTGQLCKKLQTGKRGTYLKIKYSNVNAKMFIQIVFKELDLIIQDIKDSGKWDLDKHARLTYIRYKTEMTFDDMWFIDDEIILGDNVKSFCGRNKMRFLWYVNDLCTYNVRKFSNLIVFHPPVNQEQEYRFETNGTSYTTYKKHGNYIVTPININETNIYVDYIGFGGFKICIPYDRVPVNDITIHQESMHEHIKELDEAIQIALSVNNYKDLWGKTPWKYFEGVPTKNWVEEYTAEPKQFDYFVGNFFSENEVF